MIFLGSNLRYLREKKGYKQSEMQAQLGFKQSTWNGYETNNSFPNLSDFIKISDYFKVPEHELLHVDLTLKEISPTSSSNGHVRKQPISPDFPQKEGKNTSQTGSFVTESVTNPSQTVTKVKQNALKQGENAQELKRVYALNEVENKYGYNLGMPKVITVNERQEENIIYVPVKARAGYLVGHGDPEFIQSLTSYRLPGVNNGTYRMFEADGESMTPTIIHGDKLIGRWVGSMNEIRDNRVYVIVTHNGILVKRVLNRIEADGKLVLKSDTIHRRKDYPTTSIDPSEIIEIWYCRMKLSSDFSEPSEVYHRISDLEAEMVSFKAENKEIKASMTTILKLIQAKD